LPLPAAATGAVPVAAGIGNDAAGPTGLALIFVSAQRSSSAERKLCQNALDLQASTAVTVLLDILGGTEPQDFDDA